MARRKIPEGVEPEGFTMTPMIDIVFQLIIFFMLLVDMSRQELARLVLPEAIKSVEDNERKEGQIVVNIMADGEYQIGGKKYQQEGLKALFQERREMPEYQDPADPNFVSYPLLIRADGAAAYEHIQWLLMASVRYGRVQKLQLITQKLDQK